MFSGLEPGGSGASAASALSVLAHTVLLLVLVLVPLLRPAALIDVSQGDYLRILIYDPPPPPPPPLPRGTLGLARPKPREPAPQLAETPPLSESRLQAPIEALTEPVVVVATGNEAEQAGSPTGSAFGVPEGMEGGVEGGVVGGVLGGVLGGVIGGTGTGPVPTYDYDRPPRILRQLKPKYPPDAFAKKIEGMVLVELLIDDVGRVVRARVIQSVPALDEAALEAVRGWAFVPAYKHGRPVATVARAPVTFRIY